MSTDTTRPTKWLTTHPWVARFAGFEVLFIAIALLSLVALGNDFGGLFYAMAVSIAGLGVLTAVVAQLSRYVTSAT